MEFSTKKKKESCQHDDYCNFSETLCEETDFQEHCHMKDTPVEKMPLVKSVKERLERDKEYEAENKEK